MNNLGGKLEDKSQPKKSFFKRFWWIGLVLIVLIAGFCYAWITSHNQSEKSKTGQDTKDSGKTETNVSLSKDLPSCPANTSKLFTKPFMDGDLPDFITPLGNSNETGHVVPVDHVYPTNITYAASIPVYAPGNLTLIWVENKQIHNKNTNEIIAPDYQLNFAPCRGINLAFIHLSTISDKLDDAIADENSNCDDQQMDAGTRDGVLTYYVTCHPTFKKIQIKAGELLGTIIGKKDKEFQGFDIGIYDYNRPALAFANPDRYYDDTLHTACFADYYIPDLKVKYQAKFGTMEFIKSNNQKTFEKRTIEPLCGQVMQDVVGTAAGDWFKNPIKKDNTTDNDALVLIHYNINPVLAKISMANVTSFTFEPTHNGTKNREFSEIKADSQVYCYEYNKSDNVFKKILIQLIDNTHLKAESQSGTCGAVETFKTPITYER